MEHEQRASHFSGSLDLQAFQDIYHLFEKCENATLEGTELQFIFKEHHIDLNDDQINAVLTILGNEGNELDAYEFCLLIKRAINYLKSETKQKEITEKKIIAVLKQFLQRSAAFHAAIKKETWRRKSADTLGFYFQVARLEGLTERQMAVRACGIDTTRRDSPYLKPVVLPGLPTTNNAKGSSMAVSDEDLCVVIPPPQTDSRGKRMSSCTILPYTGDTGNQYTPAPPKKYRAPAFQLSPNGTLLNPDLNKKKKKKKSDTTLPSIKEEDEAVERAKIRGRPLPFKMPVFPEYQNRLITFEEVAKIRDEIIMIRETHRKKMRGIAARRVIDSLPPDLKKRFRSTIKAYLGPWD